MKKMFSLVLFCVAFVGALPAQESSETSKASEQLTKEEVVTLYTNKVIRKVDFRETSPMEFVAWLKVQGLPVEVSADFEKMTKDIKITISLNNVPAIEVVKYVTNLSNTKYEVKDSHILLSML